MNLPLAAFFERTMRSLLRIYPPAFRNRFGNEMVQVFLTLSRQVHQESGEVGLIKLWFWAIWDGLSSALFQWGQQLTKKRLAIMNLDPLTTSDGTTPLPARQAALAVLPFLLFGISSITVKLEIVHISPLPSWQAFLIYPELTFNWLVLIGLAAGIIAGFPRWAFSYLGWALFIACQWTNISFYGNRLSGQIWLPLAAVVFISLLIRRSLRPAQMILKGLWRDLTLLPFGIYILYASLYIIADENHHPSLLLFIAGSTLAACLGAWSFFRNASPLRRVLALVGGLVLAVLLAIWNSLTWDSAAYYGLPQGSPWESILVGTVFLLVISALSLGLAWLTQWRNQRRINT